jgi:hypothetical protein
MGLSDPDLTTYADVGDLTGGEQVVDGALADTQQRTNLVALEQPVSRESVHETKSFQGTDLPGQAVPSTEWVQDFDVGPDPESKLRPMWTDPVTPETTASRCGYLTQLSIPHSPS